MMLFRSLGCTIAVTLAMVVAQPAPSDKCKAVQSNLCGDRRGDPEACMHCISINWNQTGAAGCTIPDDERFCHITPAEVKCIDALERACGTGHHTNATECDDCVKAHASSIRAANCTDPWVNEFCHPPPRPHPPSPSPPPAPPSSQCRSVLSKLCGKDRGDPEECMHCISVNWDAAGQAGCTIPDDERFCAVSPADVKCIDALEKVCGNKSHPDHRKCAACVEAHSADARAADCTAALEEEYCRPW